MHGWHGLIEEGKLKSWQAVKSRAKRYLLVSGSESMVSGSESKASHSKRLNKEKKQTRKQLKHYGSVSQPQRLHRKPRGGEGSKRNGLRCNLWGCETAPHRGQVLIAYNSTVNIKTTERCTDCTADFCSPCMPRLNDESMIIVYNTQ